MCQFDDTSSRDTVNESKWNPHDTLSDSESIHLNSSIDTGILFNPTSIKAIIERIVVVITQLHVINWAPIIPSFLPKKPDIIEANKGKKIINKYILFKFYGNISASFYPFFLRIYISLGWLGVFP